MSKEYEKIIANGLETRVWTCHPTYGYGCAECCNGDRCDEDCDAKYRRKDCPHCKGSGWIKKDDASAPPTTEQTELWKEKIARIIFKHVKGSLNPIGIIGEDVAAKEIIETIEREYSITRKQEAPEAVSFAEWIAQKHYYKDVHKEWYGCERGMTVLIAKTTAELFELFKNRS